MSLGCLKQHPGAFNYNFQIFAGLPGGHSEWEPPETIPNSEVKRNCADDSVGSPHVKVGHCQALIQKPRSVATGLFLFLGNIGWLVKLVIFEGIKCSTLA